MGYTHYWWRPPTLPKPVFDRITDDTGTVFGHLARHGVPLAGPMGDGEAILDPDEVAFNGVGSCGHRDEDLGVAWPADEATGIHGAGAGLISSFRDIDDGTDGSWYAGALLSSRRCGGDCSHESFFLPRVRERESWQTPDRDGLLFDFCKTAYKPYDLAVTAALIVLKHHAPQARVHSDGEDKDWTEARRMCQHLIGYGETFAFIGDDLEDEATFDPAVLRRRQRIEAAELASHDTHRACYGTYHGNGWSNDDYIPSDTALRPPRVFDERALADDILAGGSYDGLLEPPADAGPGAAPTLRGAAPR